jgi:hypothetical protein
LTAKEFGTVDNRRNTLGNFDKQFTILRRNFTSGKQTYGWNQPYSRPQLPVPLAPLPSVEEDVRSEVSTVEIEPDKCTVTGESLPILILATSVLHLLPPF